MSCPQVIKIVTPGPPGVGLPAGTDDAGKFLRKLGAEPYVYDLVTPDVVSGGLVAYVYSQPTPETTWTINHNLGRYPSVELFNTGMQEIDAEIAHPSINQTVVTLNPATAGLARLI
jgi:hypothetical protein